MYIITVDAIGLGYKDELVIARKLLVADDEGHPVLGVIKHLREWRLTPLSIQVLKINSKICMFRVAFVPSTHLSRQIGKSMYVRSHTI